VTSASARLGAGNERPIPVNRDHLSICKFDGSGDEMYKLVLAQIQRLVTLLQSRAQAQLSGGYTLFCFARN